MAVVSFMIPQPIQHASKGFENFNGEWVETYSYKVGKFYNGLSVEIDGIDGLSRCLLSNIDNPCFMICGEFIEPDNLYGIVRRKRDDGKDDHKPSIKDRLVPYLAIDVDGWPMPDGMDDTQAIAHFINNHLPSEFKGVKCVYQFSSSHGLVDTTILKVHLFFWLKDPVHNLQLQRWAKVYNEEKGWGNMIDPSIYVCTQPLFTQRRSTIGADDPIIDMLGVIEGGSELCWNPDLYFSNMPEGEAKASKERIKKNTTFDKAGAIRDIGRGIGYHDNLNGLAMSMANFNYPPKQILSFLEGLMNIVEDKDRDDRWIERYGDLQRTVDTAIEIVGNLSFDDVLEWIDNASDVELRLEFTKKVVNLDPVSQKMAIGEINKRLKLGPQVLNRAVKELSEELDKEKADFARMKDREEKSANGIHEIVVSNDGIGEAAREVATILAKTQKQPRIYGHGSGIAIISHSKPKTVSQCRKLSKQGLDYPKMPLAYRLNDKIHSLLEIIESNCYFINDKGKSIVCPDKILRSITELHDVDWKPLTGIVEHPFVNDNWEVIQEDGYNEETGLYATLHRKLKLTPMDPKEAYRYLVDDVFGEFPFDTPLDEAAAVSCLMSAIQRPTIMGSDGMPGYAITSPIQSSGKTAMAQLISCAAFNRPIAATTWSSNDEEMGKHLLGILREGHSCVLFDNMPEGKTVRSNELTKAMTTDAYSGRQLGKNETEVVSASVMWLFTGNNIAFHGGIGSRVLPIRLKPNTADPEKRAFKRDDVGQWALDNRKKIISAVISIVMVGSNTDIKLIGSSRFKPWNKFVRRALFAVSGCDVADIFINNKMGDEEMSAKINLLELLYAEFKGEKFKTPDVINVCNGDGSGSFNSDGVELKRAITDVLGEKAAVNTVSLGINLGKIRDRIIGGFELNREGVGKEAGLVIKLHS